jgi:hypothetical protein
VNKPAFKRGQRVAWVFGDERRPGVVVRRHRTAPTGYAYTVRREDGRRVIVREDALEPDEEGAAK